MKYEISDRSGSFSLTAKSREQLFTAAVQTETVTASVPRSFAGKLVLGTVSGDIEVCAFDALERLQCDSVSGEVRFEAVAADKIMCDTVRRHFGNPARQRKRLTRAAVAGAVPTLPPTGWWRYATP